MPIHCLMYHYVRNNEDKEYDVFSRRKDEFSSQIKFLSKRYRFISPNNEEDFNYFLNSKENAFLLTFDDAYKDHLWCAYFLNKNNLNGIFFPSLNIFKGEILDVNLIHMILGYREFSITDTIEKIDFILKKNIKLIRKILIIMVQILKNI